MKTTTKTATTPAPVPSSTTPLLDATLPVVVAAYGPEDRWKLEGWAAHIRPCKHPNHARNSWRKHAGEMGECFDGARILTVARMIDFGITPDEARDCLFQEPASTRH